MRTLLLLALVLAAAPVLRAAPAPAPPPGSGGVEGSRCGDGERREEVVAALGEAIEAQERRLMGKEPDPDDPDAKHFVCAALKAASEPGGDGAAGSPCPEVEVDGKGVSAVLREGPAPLIAKAALESALQRKKPFKLVEGEDGRWSVVPAWKGADRRPVTPSEFHEAFRRGHLRHANPAQPVGPNCAGC